MGIGSDRIPQSDAWLVRHVALRDRNFVLAVDRHDRRIVWRWVFDCCARSVSPLASRTCRIRRQVDWPVRFSPWTIDWNFARKAWLDHFDERSDLARTVLDDVVG